MELVTSKLQPKVHEIPEGWTMKTLGELGEALIGLTYKPSDVASDGTLVLRSSNISAGSLKFEDNVFVRAEIPERIMVRPGDILICARNGSRDLIGKCALIDDRAKGMTFGAFMAVFRTPFSGIVFHQFQSDAIKRQIREHLGATINQITNTSLRSFTISFPEDEVERRAIATALNDVDALLASLDQLIAKKQGILRAAMQGLLSGRLRLPCFTGQWQRIRLGDVSSIKTGKKNNEDKISNGRYPFFVRSQWVERIDSYSFEGEAILVPGEGNIGNIFHYIDGRFDYHQRVYKVSDFSAEVCGKFVYYCMAQYFGEHAMRNSVKATVDSLRLPTFKAFEFLAPSLDEQVAIASAISDMDAEIAALESRRVKTLDLKQGMMQELLTGRTRLV